MFWIEGLDRANAGADLRRLREHAMLGREGDMGEYILQILGKAQSIASSRQKAEDRVKHLFRRDSNTICCGQAIEQHG